MKDINELIKKINSKDSLPPRAFRRNVPIYQLVSTVNNLIACLVSENYKPIENFVERAKVFIEDNPDIEGCQPYYNLVLELLEKVSKDERLLV